MSQDRSQLVEQMRDVVASKPELIAMVRGQLKDARDTLEVMEGYVKALEIANDEHERDAIDRGVECQKNIKDIDEKRKQTVQPFNEVVKIVNAECKRVTTGFEAVKSELRQKVQVYRTKKQEEAAARARALEEKARREAEAAEKAREAGDSFGGDVAEVRSEQAKREAEAVAKASQAASSGDYGSTATIRKWEYRVVDLDKIPRVYLEINHGALRLAAKVKPKPPEIPGIEWSMREEVQIRSR